MPDGSVDRSFDYVVVGAGAAGATLAHRLAASGRFSVALIEAGQDASAVPEVMDFRRYQEAVAGPNAVRLPAAGPDGRPISLPLGRMLGGSTSLNTCIWLRPPASDFDAWVEEGAAGWTAEAATTSFDRIESALGFETAQPDNLAHAALFAAAAELGFPRLDFARSVATGFGPYRFNLRGVMRQSAATIYLNPVTRPPQLTVFTDAAARSLLFDATGRVIGIDTSRGRFTARAEVILSAGAIGTPKLLLLSGIGPAAALQALGIAVRRNLSGVGRHLLDHPAVAVNFAARRALEPAQPWNYAGILFAAVEASAPWPDVEIQLGAELFQRHAVAAGYLAHDGDGFCAYLTVNRAVSEGSLRLRSPDPRDDPVIDLGYFTDPGNYDLRVMVGGLRLARQLFAARALRDWIAGEVSPGPEAESDDALADYVRRTATTGYHQAGTCRMGAPDDAASVVGPDLRVIGVEGLRIADASIFPSMISVNIAPTCWMIGHRAAELILAPHDSKPPQGTVQDAKVLF